MSGSLTVDRMTAGDAMHTGIACDVHAPLGAVARMMAAHRIHCVVVRNSAMEVTDPGAGLWGVISDLDLVRLVATDAVGGRTAARARNPAVVVDERDSVQEAARLMADNDVTHLVVVNHAAKPVGVFSTLDVAQAVSDAIHVPR